MVIMIKVGIYRLYLSFSVVANTLVTSQLPTINHICWIILLPLWIHHSSPRQIGVVSANGDVINPNTEK